VLAPRIPRGLHTPVTVSASKVPGGYDLHVTFRAPFAVRNASTAYGTEVLRPGGSACGGGGGAWGQSIERNVARGETLRVTEFVPQPHGCHGIERGRVTLSSQLNPLPGPGHDSETIARFSFNLP
jgi:hypothetical protein